MDNRNDFIHIDEVFKRLKDREEPEPSGAWLKMQELLNEEMPAGAPAAGSMLRKYMTPLVALLLLGSSGVAYYAIKNNAKDAQKTSFAVGNHAPASYNNTSVSSSDKNDMGLKTDPSALSNGGHSSNNNHSKNTLAAVHSNESNKNNDPNKQHFTKNNHTHSGSTSSDKSNNVNNAKTIAASNIQHNNTYSSGTGNASHSNDIVKQGNVKNAHQNSAHSNNNKSTASGNTTNTHHTASQNVMAGTAGSVNNNHNAKHNNSSASGIVASNNASISDKASHTAVQPVLKEEQNVVEQIYPAAENTNGNNPASIAATKKHTGKEAKNITSNSVTAAAGMTVVANSWNNDKIVKDKDGSYYKEVRDTFKKIDMMERTVASNNYAARGSKKYINVMDTLAITRVERVRYQPLAPLEMAALRQAKIIPQSYIASPIPAKNKPKQYTVTNEMVSIVPLANYKVHSRKVDPSKFNQLMTGATQGISNYFDGTNKFYAAILLGGNAFLSNTGAFGMQFGIAGLYQLSERLTLGMEFKFANHYFSNYTINDKTVSYDNISSQQVSGIEWLFKGTQTTTNTAYKINSYSELQFPVTLNYSFGRLSVLGGLNLAYAFPIKWSTSNNVIIEDVSTTETSSSNPFLNTNSKIDNNADFASRFGVGYVGGLSYDLSRKVSLDARVTQNVWSSYNGNANNISQLFKTPTFQFSISYFFGRKDRVVYIMDRR